MWHATDSLSSTRGFTRERKREKEKERDHRPIRVTYYNQLVGVCRPAVSLSVSLSLYLYIFPYSLFPSRFFYLVVRMPTEEQRKKAGCHAQKPPRRRGGNVLLAVTFDRSTFRNHSLHLLRMDVSLLLCNLI